MWGLLPKAELTCASTALQHPDRPREGICEREKVSKEEKKRKRKSQRERKGREKGGMKSGCVWIEKKAH